MSAKRFHQLSSTVKDYHCAIACLAFMIWSIVKAKGVSPIVDQPGMLHGYLGYTLLIWDSLLRWSTRQFLISGDIRTNDLVAT
ncbi:hypothetical protein BU15DRAFT_83244 [Melanogaster broomeanus]|nr:hypothetical protein BU15DRAFT_83244 [Melanogaster broomeanus]